MPPQSASEARPHLIPGAALWAWQQQAQQAALTAGIEPQELTWLLRALTDLAPLHLRLGDYRTTAAIPSALSLVELAQLWQRRLQERVPVQHLVGYTTWRQFQLQVSPAALIPRPETELFIDLALAACQAQPELAKGAWVDLGTGSGAIALALANELPEATIHAVDCSPAALELARTNAAQLHRTSRLHFWLGSWWQPLAALAGQVSGAIANPPYIPSDQIAQLQPEVACHEPRLALDGGADGLQAVRQLIDTTPTYLQPGGFWAVELMVGQAPLVAELMTNQGDYEQITIHRDLAGRDRFVSARRR
ncbi:MAG: peptide chain release factor N(5)-glutamine methyltransferase [Spirulinaceae cyanobacterium SM2_1_0]|nr:peptide chain release factor N(5)-glutamine methyltransferase [Spirulinaceae cyanobacterium SM2_1_0]